MIVEKTDEKNVLRRQGKKKTNPYTHGLVSFARRKKLFFLRQRNDGQGKERKYRENFNIYQKVVLFLVIKSESLSGSKLNGEFENSKEILL